MCQIHWAALGAVVLFSLIHPPVTLKRGSFGIPTFPWPLTAEPERPGACAWVQRRKKTLSVSVLPREVTHSMMLPGSPRGLAAKPRVLTASLVQSSLWSLKPWHTKAALNATAPTFPSIVGDTGYMQSWERRVLNILRVCGSRKGASWEQPGCAGPRDAAGAGWLIPDDRLLSQGFTLEAD